MERRAIFPILLSYLVPRFQELKRLNFWCVILFSPCRYFAQYEDGRPQSFNERLGNVPARKRETGPGKTTTERRRTTLRLEFFSAASLFSLLSSGTEPRCKPLSLNSFKGLWGRPIHAINCHKTVISSGTLVPTLRKNGGWKMDAETLGR